MNVVSTPPRHDQTGSGRHPAMGVADCEAPPTVRLTLLGGFELRADGRPLVLMPASQAVVALLALRGGWTARTAVSAALWPGTDCRRAAGNLRSTLWRIPEACRGVVVGGEAGLALSSRVACDVWEMTAKARRLIGGHDEPADRSPAGLLDDLLPAWYDDWVLGERELLAQLRALALEALCRRQTGAGRFAEAIDAALAGIAIEPLREGGHRALIEAHLAEGNVTEAVRQYRRYRDLLAEGLGAAPSRELQTLVAGATKERPVPHPVGRAWRSPA